MGASGASIGANIAYKLAENSKNPQIHLISRNQSSADPVIAKLKELNAQGTYQFHPCVPLPLIWHFDGLLLILGCV